MNGWMLRLAYALGFGGKTDDTNVQNMERQYYNRPNVKLLLVIGVGVLTVRGLHSDKHI